MHIKLSIQFLKVGVYAQLDRLWLHNWQVYLYTCTVCVCCGQLLFNNLKTKIKIDLLGLIDF